jgi:hypothetical protein
MDEWDVMEMEIEEGYLSDSKVSTILMVLQLSIFLSDFRRRFGYGYGGVGKGGGVVGTTSRLQQSRREKMGSLLRYTEGTHGEGLRQIF